MLHLDWDCVLVSSVVKMVVYHGRPKLRPFAELKLWLQSVLSTTDTQYGFMALLFIRSVPTRLIFVPSTILALYHVSSYLNTIFGTSRWWVKYGQSRYQKLAQNQNSALLLNAVSEIGVAMIMSVQLIKSFRSVLTVVLYWQWLRLRYHSPDASWYHRQAWANVGQRLNPILDMVPFLKGPLGYAKQWFTNMRWSGWFLVEILLNFKVLCNQICQIFNSFLLFLELLLPGLDSMWIILSFFIIELLIPAFTVNEVLMMKHLPLWHLLTFLVQDSDSTYNRNQLWRSFMTDFEDSGWRRVWQQDQREALQVLEIQMFAQSLNQTSFLKVLCSLLERLL